MLSDSTFLFEVSHEVDGVHVSMTHRSSGRSAEQICESTELAQTAARLRRDFIEGFIGPLDSVRFHTGRSANGDVMWAESSLGHQTGVRQVSALSRQPTVDLVLELLNISLAGAKASE